MKTAIAALLAVVCFLAASFCGGQPGSGTPPAPGAATPAVPASPLRVGTFDQQSVVVAYYRSEINLRHHQEMVEAHKAALDAGDTKRAKKLEKQGADQQDLAMQQMLNKAPIDNVIGWTNELLSGVAAAAGVDVIVIGKVVHPADVQPVDVTEQYLAALKADDATRKVIAELKAKTK
jgi:hypothetical protein